MKPFVKCIAGLTTAFLLLGSAYATPINLWDIAQPMPANGFLAPETTTNVFSFHTPTAGWCISISYIFYTDPNCQTQATLPNRHDYQDITIDSNHANKTYYITNTALYSILELLAPASYDNIQCAKEEDLNTMGNAIIAQITCNTGSRTCDSSGGTQALPQTATQSLCPAK